ncbi:MULTISPECIES: hypothetical protein [Agrobacterium]|uniref:Uncharacterized protein n=1 Tax=Agrobacterium salinitolerans TaxID=1183413 RepID=A0A9X3R0L8_9HYPH|nr:MULTISPECIES: hypothetical protein [Agrobacterium]MCZ7890272.1 hypothetical protein [Agrobacterium salinitolerans]MCZ7938634.1 hypothetical protein [Agrobacterium salinitolerans]MDA5637100.1 hypothetical protein [Agrobacterium sp. ST15.13.013]MDA6996906.1 hypothetical protein [Agrobacterium salinitolerans]TRA96995.1 hypothetical protein EXN23_01820 [Agrobacterium salinitolerans]
MKHIVLFSVGFLFSAIFVSETEARKSRFFAVPGFGGGETIDLVYDLPDNEPFLRDGEAFDIGYLNSGDRSGYVLYRGERYSRLSDADIARLKATLGFDPTTKDRMERAARGGETPWNLVIIIAVAIVGIFVLVHKSMQLVRWISRLATISAVAGSTREEEETPDPLEVRKKQLVNRQWSDSQTDHAARIPAVSPAHASTRGTTAVRTFGRRSA